ncbi:MAG TPA: hypothetical protein VK869_02080 [Rubrobacteraceae bacterium]|nr:hypothetical protein [Rubrobacteraceae bacterium]
MKGGPAPVPLRYAIEAPLRAGLVLGFAAFGEAEIRAGIRRLAVALD